MMSGSRENVNNRSNNCNNDDACHVGATTNGALFHMQQQQQQHGGDQQQFNPVAAALNMGMVSPIPPAMFDNGGHDSSRIMIS